MLKGNFNLENVNYIFIDDVDRELIKETIKSNFVSLCWGRENEKLYDISNVIEEFMKRFSSKNMKLKYGFVGELIYYIFILNNPDVIKPISLFYNAEERSFKKGFDLLGYDGQNVWYSEVKSGLFSGNNIDEFNIQKLDAAYSDISNKLKSEDRNHNYWESAKSNIIKIIYEKKQREAIAKILSNDEKTSVIKNKIIVSVIFNDSDVCLDMNIIKNKYEKIKLNDDKITIVSIRKKTIEKVIDILEEVKNESK